MAAVATPKGEAQVRAALVAAATDLFAERGPANVTVREVASRAGVNHGLVHYYFGSKPALLAAVLDAGAHEVAQEMERADGIALLAQADSAVVRHTRILAHVILDAGDPARLQHDFPTQRRLVEAFRTRGLSARDARVRAAQVSAFVLGWHLFGEFLVSAAGVGSRQDRGAVVRDGVTRLLS
jgi:AcrR family transcriptional regulator